MSKFMFIKIGEKIFQIEDLGESVNTQFLRLHESHFSGRGFDLTKFRKEALDFFDIAMAIITLTMDFLIILPLFGNPF